MTCYDVIPFQAPKKLELSFWIGFDVIQPDLILTKFYYIVYNARPKYLYRTMLTVTRRVHRNSAFLKFNMQRNHFLIYACSWISTFEMIIELPPLQQKARRCGDEVLISRVAIFAFVKARSGLFLRS